VRAVLGPYHALAGAVVIEWRNYWPFIAFWTTLLVGFWVHALGWLDPIVTLYMSYG
jgi:hypothetical protein